MFLAGGLAGVLAFRGLVQGTERKLSRPTQSSVESLFGVVVTDIYHLSSSHFVARAERAHEASGVFGILGSVAWDNYRKTKRGRRYAHANL